MPPILNGKVDALSALGEPRRQGPGGSLGCASGSIYQGFKTLTAVEEPAVAFKTNGEHQILIDIRTNIGWVP
ncbi:MAG: hypothetical protein K2X25_17030 [Caulobacteraceae bacterium]|nr:hypothetical protein [Caulobacteraceae bacterium]